MSTVSCRWLLLEFVCLLIVRSSFGWGEVNPSGVRTGPSTASIPNGYNNYPDVGVAYKLHRERKTWSEAKRICVSEGGRLAVVDDPAKVVHLASLVEHSSDAWLGITKNGSQWFAVDGSIPRHIPWGSLQPSYSGDCTIFRGFTRGVYNSDCSWQKYFLCEIITRSTTNGGPNRLYPDLGRIFNPSQGNNGYNNPHGGDNRGNYPYNRNSSYGYPTNSNPQHGGYPTGNPSYGNSTHLNSHNRYVGNPYYTTTFSPFNPTQRNPSYVNHRNRNNSNANPSWGNPSYVTTTPSYNPWYVTTTPRYNPSNGNNYYVNPSYVTSTPYNPSWGNPHRVTSPPFNPSGTLPSPSNRNWYDNASRGNSSDINDFSRYRAYRK